MVNHKVPTLGRPVRSRAKSVARQPSIHSSIDGLQTHSAKAKTKPAPRVTHTAHTTRATQSTRAIRTPRPAAAKPSRPAPITYAKKPVKPAKRIAYFSWREATLLGIIFSSTLCIILSFIISSALDPARLAEKALTRLADDYYIEYYYPSVVNGHFDSPEDVLAEFADPGLPSIRLRQILHYKPESIPENYLSALQGEDYNCDTNSTTLKFYPVEPYGPRDYRLDLSFSCSGLADML